MMALSSFSLSSDGVVVAGGGGGGGGGGGVWPNNDRHAPRCSPAT